MLTTVSSVTWANENSYRLNPGDQLSVSVWKEDGLQKTITLLPDGTISFPLVGHIQAAGMTAEELEASVKEKLSVYIADPVVNITVESVQGNVFYVVGQVNKPGLQVMSQQTSVVQALAMAGGLTAYASRNGINIIRRLDGRDEVLKVRYSDIKDGSDLSTNHMLRSRDVIIVC